MKPIMKTRLTVLLGGLVLLAAWSPANGFAMDAGGCLTCHQYPGLTGPVTSEGFKVFHIDEEEYLASPHGKTDCRECHTTVHKVPHVGETAVTCSNGCHQEEKDRKRVADYDLKMLHAKEKSYVTHLSDGSSCIECHDLYPHRSNELARAFINMHVSFMTCEMCHVDREKYTSLTYDWTSSETADFSGKPFGARFNPKIGDASSSAHFISRIAVFSEENGGKKPMLNTWDTETARTFLRQAERLEADEKKERLAFFHRDVHKVEISVTCNECHSDESILDYRTLGFSEKKAADLININIKGMVTKYKVFYLPEMFGH